MQELLHVERCYRQIDGKTEGQTDGSVQLMIIPLQPYGYQIEVLIEYIEVLITYIYHIIFRIWLTHTGQRLIEV